MQDHVPEGFESGGPSAAASRLWTTIGEPELVRQGQLRIEQPALLRRSGIALHVVEAGLADRDRLRMSEKPAQLVEAARFGSRRLMRVDSERRIDAVMLLCERERGATRDRSRCRW